MTRHPKIAITLAVLLAVGLRAQEVREEFDGSLANWQAIGNGIWSTADGIAHQTFGPRDDNLSALKFIGRDFQNFELTARWRQDVGPSISSGLSILFRAGDTPGPCGDVPELGPFYWLSWGRTRANYGYPDFHLAYSAGWDHPSPNVYWPCGGDVLSQTTLNQDGNWFELGEWRRVRIRVEDQNIQVFVDYDSTDPAADSEEDFVLVLEASDPRLQAGAIALNDGYANSSWDYVRITPLPECDLCANHPDACDYTCLNVDNVVITPDPVRPERDVTVNLDFAISGTPGHIIYAGLVVDGVCLPFYGGVPGPGGISDTASVGFTAPCRPGLYDVQVAVAHVYSADELCAAVADGSADTLGIGAVAVENPGDLNGDKIVDLTDLAVLLANFGRMFH